MNKEELQKEAYGLKDRTDLTEFRRSKVEQVKSNIKFFKRNGRTDITY